MKKESLSIIFVKTLLAVLLFAGMGTIIIGGGYIIGEYSKKEISSDVSQVYDLSKKEKCEKSGGKWDAVICNHLGCKPAVYCNCVISSERDRNGEITHYEGILLDISDLKHTEEELAEFGQFIGK